MLLGSYQLLLNGDYDTFVRLMALTLFALLTAVTIHEFSHSLIASVLGDATSRRLGRLSLNPLRHLEPSGTAMLLVVGFGWGKPVPVDPHQLRGPLAMTLVAAAGPLSNIVLAFLVAIPIKLGLLTWNAPSLGRATYVLTGGLREALSDIAGMVIFFNLLLAVFNLIPLAPLDGSKVVGGLIPRTWADGYAQFERYSPLLLLGIIITDYVLRLGILWGTIGPIVRLLAQLATGYQG